MHKLLEQVFSTKTIVNSRGETVRVHSETSREQCEFLQRFIRENNFKRSLEIGFAYGISTLAIMEEIIKNGGSHCVIDKFQHAEWGGNGVDLITQAGYADKLDFHEQYSYSVLPELLAKGKKFDFVYVDSTKQFDWLMVDFFFIDRLLDINGIIVFDDTGYYSVRKLTRLITQFPGYKVEAAFPVNVDPGMLNRMTSKLVASTFLKKILREGLSYADYKRGINSSTLAIRKIGEDNRDWRWHADF